MFLNLPTLNRGLRSKPPRFGLDRRGPAALIFSGRKGAILARVSVAVASGFGLLASADEGRALPLPQVVPTDTVPALAPRVGLFTREGSPLGDLALRFRGRGAFDGDWSRFRPCDPSLQLTCTPGLLPQLTPDFQFSLEAAGTIGGRLVLDVDYDQTREFGGANRFQVYLEGREDGFLERLELGDVTLALPASRFLTRGIPAGNFGVLARARQGPVEFQGVVAQQQGARQIREFRLRGGEEGGVIREDTVVVEDAAYVRSQFFFLVDPTTLASHPHIDVLDLRPADASPHVLPGAEPIQLWRMERDPALRQTVEGFVRADAQRIGSTGERVQESGWFRYLRPGIDYYLHPSGLWVALRIPLRPDEALAVGYITILGDTVGTYDPERLANRGRIPTLNLVRATAARHQPGRPTWEQEMRQVYRLSASDEVELDGLDLRISLGEESGGQTFFATPEGRSISLLRLFGLDRDTPFERVDARALFQPGGEDGLEAGIRGTFLIFPTLRPFMEPPPPATGRGDGDALLALLGRAANRRIYEAPDPLDRDASGLFRMNLTLRTRNTRSASTFPLGSFGVLEGSERIYLGDRLLRPGLDYLMDPELGTVTLLQPEFLLARSPSDRLRISWEQATLFRPRPTALFGGSTRIDLGVRGETTIVGLYQAEQQTLARPRFGAEPAAAGMLGARSTLGWEAPWMDALVQRLFRVRDGALPEAGGRIELAVETAMSLPNPNLSGDAFLDDFDTGDERRISLLASNWHLGSAPAFPDGVPTLANTGFGAAEALPLVWQHNWIEVGPAGDSIGVVEGFFPRSEIDRQISLTGTETREPGLLLSFGARPGVEHAGPRWRSVTTLLSATGTDLSQAEYLDFYVADGDALTLILDLGAVSEDAFFVDGTGATSGFRPDDGRPWGLGILDQEADPLRGEIWDRNADARGVWPETCEADPGKVYPLGDPRANCTRGNGRRDTEDLNGNGILDTEERAARYVVRLDGSSPYVVRDRGDTGTRFRLYRIPLRGPDALFPGGELSAADWRAIQFLRLTVVGSRSSRLAVARMRFVGSRWAKRSGEGVLRGLGGDTVSLATSFDVTPVGVLSEGAAYQPPPGVLELLDDPASAVGGRGVEFSERSLALRFRGLAGGDRVEVFSRFFQRPRDFLAYRELRLWALARSGDFGPGSEDLRVFVKVGSDPENFYLWLSPLEPAPDPGAILPADWLPERILRFRAWLELRVEAEQALLARPPSARGDPVVVWSADSTYAIVLNDRARAPNLAAVRELSLGVWNPGIGSGDGEVWFNELRLGGGIRGPGYAHHLDFTLDGGEAYQFRIGLEGTSPRFQSLEAGPNYQRDGHVNLSGSVQLGGLLPDRWGVDFPLSVSHRSFDETPAFLAGSDLDASAISGLRTAGIEETRALVTLRTVAETGLPTVDRVLAGLEGRVGIHRSRVRSLTTQTRSSGSDVGLALDLRPARREVDLIPWVLEPVIRIFFPPGMARSLNQAQVRWTPTEFRIGTTLRREERILTRFQGILVGSEALGAPQAAPEEWLESRGRIAFQPLGTLTMSADLVSERDLLDPDLASLDARVVGLLESARREFLGQDLGWETRRHLLVRAGVRPTPFRGLRTEISGQSRYGTDRNVGLVRLRAADTEDAGSLLRNARVDRELRVAGTLDLGVLWLGLPTPTAADPSSPQGGRDPESGWARGLRSLSPLTVVLQDGVVAAFFREDVDPALRFQLGLGGVGALGSADGVPAASVVDRRALTLGSGLRLPASFFFNLNRQETRLSSLDLRSQRDGKTTSWPDIRAGASRLPLPEGWDGVLTRVAFTSGVLRLREEVQYGQGLQTRERTEVRVPVEITMEWVGGITARYRGTVAKGDGIDPTGRTGRDQWDHGISLETRLRPLRGMDSALRESFRLAFLAQAGWLEECRVPSGTFECIPFLERETRSLALSLDTFVSGFELGAQLAFQDRQAFSAFESGFRQFQLGLWGRMELAAGPVERLDLRRAPRDPFRR